MTFDPRIHDSRCREFWRAIGAPEDVADVFAYLHGWEPTPMRCVLTPILAEGETITVEPETKAPAEGTPASLDETKPDEKETPEDIEKRARKPPSDGKCQRCGEPKPINRLKLCYPCWVKFENEKLGWKEGQPHPKGCGCDTDCVIERPHN